MYLIRTIIPQTEFRGSESWRPQTHTPRLAIRNCATSRIAPLLPAGGRVAIWKFNLTMQSTQLYRPAMETDPTRIRNYKVPPRRYFLNIPPPGAPCFSETLIIDNPILFEITNAHLRMRQSVNQSGARSTNIRIIESRRRSIIVSINCRYVV